MPKSLDPNSHLYDKDLPSHVLLISDWMHEPADNHLPGHLKYNVGQEPDSYLVNGKGYYMVNVYSNKLYMYMYIYFFILFI